MALAGVFLASLAIFINVVLYVRQQDQLDRQKTIQVLNCVSNKRQDNSLSRMLSVTLKQGVRDPKVRREFKAFVEKTTGAPKCPPLPKKGTPNKE